jgi:hypothetical protein
MSRIRYIDTICIYYYFVHTAVLCLFVVTAIWLQILIAQLFEIVCTVCTVCIVSVKVL